MFSVSGVGDAVVGTVAIVGGALVVGVSRAVKQTYAKRQTDRRDTESLREFFFDTEKNESTGVPAKKGWTTKVDERLTSQDTMLKEIKGEVTKLVGRP